jgi:hypothetical protein
MYFEVQHGNWTYDGDAGGYVMTGKGSTPRPFSVAQEQYEARWDMIFGRDKGDKERDFEFDKELDKREQETKDE